MIGQMISHYRILVKLGEGGMGIVYKAEDTKLKRTVALKFLHPELTRDEEAKVRFIHEAQAASALEHPNICNIHEINETEDGRLFIVMACYEGQTLKDMVGAYGHTPIPISEVIDIAMQVARGLQKAHEKGIVHRDIKPANIFLTTDGVAKILDFGLAKLKGQIRLTKEGTTVGTVAYMSPEQTRGEEVNHRTDIWSLGVVLYEMLTGQLPFKGEYDQALIYSILNEEPESVLIMRSDTPMELQNTVQKTLQKESGKRYQDMSELIAELQSMQKKLESESAKSFGKEVRLPSIAVLPFVNMSPDPDNEYFSDGLAEELINALSRLHGLHVTARTSAFRFRGKDLDIREIGKQLNVCTVMEGSVRRAGNRLRVTAQLIDIEHGYHIWSERYDRELDDIFAIQDDITTAIVNSLKVTLSVGEKTALKRRSTADTEAYSHYLKGLYFYARPSPESFKKALNFYRFAIDKDPNFALAYAGMASVYGALGIMNLAPPTEMWPKAKAALQKALSLDKDLAEAHAVAASLAFWYEWDWEAAGQSFDRVLSLNPGDALSHGQLGWFCLNRRRFDESIREIKKALELDPLMPLYYAWSVGLHWSVGRPDEALQEFAKAMEIDPNLGLAYFHGGVSYVLEGFLDEAEDTFEKGKKLFAPPGWMEAMQGLISVKKGDRERAARLLENAIETKKTVKNVSAPSLAWLAGELGELDLAFEFLDKAYEERDILMCFVHIYTGIFSPMISADPRFKNVLAKMKLDISPLPEMTL